MKGRTVQEYTVAGRVCEKCGQVFSTSPGNVRKGYGNTCSRRCAAARPAMTARAAFYKPAHPLATKAGKVLAYRATLYDAIGPGTHACYWCGTPVSWTTRIGAGVGSNELIVDHLDGNFHNNDLGNLVPACNNCNTVRGYIKGWEKRTRMSVNGLLNRR